MSWTAGVPTEVWAIISTVIAGLGTQIGMLFKWRREDKLRAEKREEEYQLKIQALLVQAIDREKEFTLGLIEQVQSTAELRLVLIKVTDLLEDVAQFLKDSLRKGT